MKGIVFGAGFLGTRIANRLGYRLVSKQEVNPLNLDDLRRFLNNERPEVVVNAVGKTGRPNIDWCEDNKRETLQSNVVAAINLSAASDARGIYFVHISSGSIYNGYPEGGFKETDEPNFYGPQFYAKTKIMSEMALRELPGLLLRVSLPIDDRPNERNLIDKLISYPKVISAPNSMTTVPHAISTIESLVQRRSQGIYNLVNPGLISAGDIIHLYQELVDPTHTFESRSLNELDRVISRKRSNCHLNTDKLASEGLELPEIHTAVRECLIAYRGDKQ